MTLEEAVSKFEDGFYHVDKAKSVHETPDLKFICSGGIIDVKGVMPCLYSSEEKAVEAWLDTASSLADYNDDCVLEWVYAPETVGYQMTMADRHSQQRLVTTRYAVRSQFRTK